jgi:type II secretion system protein I
MKNKERIKAARADSAFTLLEVLVALSILAIAAAALFQVFSGSLRAIERSREYTLLLVRADEKVRFVLANDKLTEGNWQEMTQDGIRTVITVSPLFADRTANMSFNMFDITVTVSSSRISRPSNKTVTLRTTKIVSRVVAQQQSAQGQES